MSIERTEKEPITSREIIFRELELSENRWVWNGVETGNPLWINYIFSCRTGEAPRKDCEKSMEISMLFRQPGRNRIHRQEKPHLPERIIRIQK